MSESMKKRNNKRIKLSKNIRLAGLMILLLVLIFSLVSANAAYQKQEITQKPIVILTYSQTGSYDYTVYLKNNTVYEGKEYLKPYDNLKIFKNLVDSIQARFTYIYNLDKTADIQDWFNIEPKFR